MAKTFRQIRQYSVVSEDDGAGSDAGREEDKLNMKLGPDHPSPNPSDEDEESDELDRTHQVIDAVKPLYTRDKHGGYTIASNPVSTSGPMSQMIRQDATKNLNSGDDFVGEGEELLENVMDSLKKIVMKKTASGVRFDDGGRVKIDTTTASAILGVHGALNPMNQKKMAELLSKNSASFQKMAKFSFKQFGGPPGKLANTPVK
tara:strand:+ start:2978 stop:3586 length:609 start_codon:yes stop_codon:yes gene_type:complete